VFSWYGAAWIVVLLGTALLARTARAQGRRLGPLAAWSGLLLVPALVTLVTMDGTRVFVAVSFPAFLA
jgi:hypothetical protein